jgi:hypothetical protein
MAKPRSLGLVCSECRRVVKFVSKVLSIADAAVTPEACSCLATGFLAAVPRKDPRPLVVATPASYYRPMCRNITTLRGLDPRATDAEIEAAARQYVHKVSGIRTPSARTEEAFERAVGTVARATRDLLGELPARLQPPATLPPSRRVLQATRFSALTTSARDRLLGPKNESNGNSGRGSSGERGDHIGEQ